MPIEDVFKIPGQGTIVSGTVERGTVSAGRTVELVGTLIQWVTVQGIELTGEKPHRMVDRAEAGQRVGLSLSAFDKKVTKRGVVVADPGTIRPHGRAEARLRIAAEADGGIALESGATVSVRIHRVRVSAKLTLPEGTGPLLPGAQAAVTVELGHVVAMETGTPFTVSATGTITMAGEPVPASA